MAARVVLARPALRKLVCRARYPPWNRTYASISNRQRVEILAKEIESVFGKPDYDVNLLGSHRRGEQNVQEATMLITAQKDDYLPLSPHSSEERCKEKSNDLVSRLVAAGVLDQSKDLARVTMRGEATLPVRVHYASKRTQGAAELCLTGDESFIRFLKIMAMEIGLVLTESGLWRPLGARGRTSSRGRRRTSDDNALPPGIAIQTMGSKVQESEGDRRMRETRKEMGLPEGLDLSLDLDAGSKKADQREDVTVDNVEAALAEQLQDKTEKFEYIAGKSGSEHDIFDALGLVWLPPAMRFVKEPGSRK